MNKFFGFSAMLALLAACNERPAAGVDDPVVDPEDPPIVDAGTITGGDLRGATFTVDGIDPDNNTLTVRITLDGNDFDQEYARVGTLVGYDEFEFQQSATTRIFRAFAAESDDGSVQATVVSEGDQFNISYGGNTATQLEYEAPAGGIVEYTGDYVGLVNFGESSGTPVPGCASCEQSGSTAVTGTVFLQADFTDGAVTGAIYDRALEGEDIGEGIEQEIVLIVSDIGTDGSFAGSVETLEQAGIGSYSGVFGGTDASSVAGLVNLGAGLLGVIEQDNPEYDPDTNPGVPETIFVPLGDGNENEYGIFVLSR